MVFDGTRALIVGEYLTPSSGQHAGQLGPWSKLVEALGGDPRSTAMKTAFVGIGAIHLAGAVGLAIVVSSLASWLAIVAAVLGLWYLPFGTAADVVAIAVVMTTSLRP